ncbi:MAG: hypothetical protein WBF88_17680 [Pusillimonas sp.]
MSEVIEQESTELVTLPPKESALTVYSNVGGLDPLIEQIRAKVAGTVYNMSTAKGRDECRSDAAKVARSKTAIEKLGKALSAEYKEIPKKIDAERKRAFDELEALQKQVRQPLTEWEEAEERRVAKHRGNIETLKAYRDPETLHGADVAVLKQCIGSLTAVVIDQSWEEFEAEAHRVKVAALESLSEALAVRKKYEADQAELARLKAEAEARAKKDEQDRIAREAAEAATKAAEAKAQAERDAAAKREADAKAAQAKAEQDAKDAAERQKRAEEQAETERLASAERAKQAAESARLAEIKRQADEAARIEAEAKAREADRAHKSKVLCAAKEAIMKAGITEDRARDVVKLIAAGKVPKVSITY